VRQAAAGDAGDWPTAAAIPDLASLMKSAADDHTRTLARRGLVRLVRVDAAGTDAGRLALLRAAMEQAGAADRKAILAAAGDLKDPAAFAWVAGYLADAEVQAEAELAALQIAEKLGQGSASVTAPVLKQIRESGATNSARRKAGDLLTALGSLP